jgi:septal ring factor EnvC (AmiA/AmiB activator)
MRRWKRITWLLLSWSLLPGTLCLWAARTEPTDKDLSQRRKDLKEIRKEITLTKQKEKAVQGQETSILEHLSQIETDLYRKEQELKQMEKKRVQTTEKLQQTKRQVQELHAGLEKTREEFFSRLVALYKMGRIPSEVFLFMSQSYPDLLKLGKYLRVIMDSDVHLVETYRHQVVLKERYRETLTEDRTQWEKAIEETDRKRLEIQKGKAEKRNVLKSIRNQKVVYQKLIAEMEGRAKELQALVDRLEREKKASAYVRTKPETGKGKLTPPVHGNVISSFKEKGQNGIEIKAPLGTEIRSILSGKVLYADWFKGFGNVMIIDHGEQTFTVSGYCSQLLKKTGDLVGQGEVIALVGSAGSLKGPCLYFEVRHQGKPQNPMEWISPLEKMVSLPEGKGKGGKGQ